MTLPNSKDEIWIMEGVNGFLIAADVEGVGHFTEYPSDKETVALQVPFKDGVVPNHVVLKIGACNSRKQVVRSGEGWAWEGGGEL